MTRALTARRLTGALVSVLGAAIFVATPVPALATSVPTATPCLTGCVQDTPAPTPGAGTPANVSPPLTGVTVPPVPTAPGANTSSLPGTSAVQPAGAGNATGGGTIGGGIVSGGGGAPAQATGAAGHPGAGTTGNGAGAAGTGGGGNAPAAGTNGTSTTTSGPAADSGVRPQGLSAVAARLREISTQTPYPWAFLLVLFFLAVMAGQRRRVSAAVLDGSARTLEYRGTKVQLTSRESDLLAFLLAHPDEFFTTDQLVTGAWNAPGRSAEDVRVYVSRLRQKLAPLDLPWRVASQQWVGYSLATADGNGKVPVTRRNISAPAPAPVRKKRAAKPRLKVGAAEDDTAA